jgi:RNA polymerase sigma-54 factor
MLKQGLQQKLLQKLSPQQIQFIKLLQIPAASLEARIKEELEENPALLDAATPESPTDEAREGEPSEEEADRQAEQVEEGLGDISLDEFLNQEDYAYRTRQAEDPNAEHYEAPIVQRVSLYDELRMQLGMLDLDDTQYLIAEQIIGNIDEDGYLRRPLTSIVDDLAFRYNVSVTDEAVTEVLRQVQKLDPPGIAARDLQECLLLQLLRKPGTPEVLLARQIIADFFEEFSKKHLDKILDRTKADPDVFKEAWVLITRLNPKPGGSSMAASAQVIIPDYLVTVVNGEVEVQLNRKNAPELRVNRSYLRMLQDLDLSGKKALSAADKETIQFVKQKIEAAKWFIDAMQQRQVTLLRTMMTIIEKQKAFFLNEDDEACLRPMILKDVAEEIGMDISTISRVASSKFVQTDFGIYPLKFFFSEGMTTQSGEEVSTREIKKVLGELIAGEEKRKPLSDDRLTELLQEKGYDIARRTVAKYREQLGIPVARLRKDL